MNILLDECLPQRLKRDLVGHTVATVPELGWAGTKNGALLRLAETQFTIFVTADQNLQYQQNLQSSILGIIVLVAPDTRYETLQPLMTTVLAVVPTIQPGMVVRIPAE
jgi:predicted nuclease of predicted toxin-antitoxin system